MATVQDTQLLYVTYYGRPADPGGLAYWTTGSQSSLPLNQVADYFAADVEYNQTIAGKTTSQIVNSFYRNAFGRDADAGGLAYWVGEVNAGRISTQDVGLFIAQGALTQPPGNPDRVVLENKISASQQWTNQVAASPTSTSRYNGWLAVANGFKYLQGVTTTIPTTTASQNAINNLPPVGQDWLAGTKWVLVDFDGHQLDGTEDIGNNYRFIGNSSGFTTAQQKDFLESLSKIYEPFNLRFTNDPNAYAGSGAYAGRLLIGKNMQFSAGIGSTTFQPFGSVNAGALANNFNAGAFSGKSNAIAGVDVDGFGSNGTVDYLAVVAAHEIGHTLQMEHEIYQTSTNFSDPSRKTGDFAGGLPVFGGTAFPQWGPLMGINWPNFTSSFIQLDKGDWRYQTADNNGVLKSATNVPQTLGGPQFDSVAHLTGILSVKPDDHGDSITGLPSRSLQAGGTLRGVINSRTDVDVFRFTHGGGSLNLSVSPAVTSYEVGVPVVTRNEVDYHPLNLKAELLNSAGVVVFTSDPVDIKTASINGSFASGTYYLRVDGVGQGSFTPPSGVLSSQGFDDYGSIGQYLITGLV